MATITITVDAGGAGTMTRVRTVTGPHLVRFVAAIRLAYNTSAELTDIQVLEMWADRVFTDARDLTRNTETRVASDGVSNIDFTP